MSKYRRGNEVVEAVEWTGLNEKEVRGVIFKENVNDMVTFDMSEITVDTHYGPILRALIGDWVVRFPSGNVLPIHPVMFRAEFEKVGE